MPVPNLQPRTSNLPSAMSALPQHFADAAADGSIVVLVYHGGILDGQLVPVAPSLLAKHGPKLTVRKRTRYATHLYEAEKPWRGEKTLAMRHRRSYRVVG